MLHWTILCAANLVAALLSYTLLAYAFARLVWRGRGILFTLFAIIISAQVWFIPQLTGALVFGSSVVLDWVWLLDWLCGCFSIVLLWLVLKDTSADHADAARLDGCGAFGIYWHIVLPLVRQALCLLAIFILITNAIYLLALPPEIGHSIIPLNWTFLISASFGMSAVPIAVFLLARKLFPSAKV
jgi:ABC-type glycerol-3-phosphate transport system permease component